MILRTREENIDYATRYLDKGFPDVATDRIHAIVVDHYDAVAERSRIKRFLPVFARRYARQDLERQTGHRIVRGRGGGG